MKSQDHKRKLRGATRTEGIFSTTWRWRKYSRQNAGGHKTSRIETAGCLSRRVGGGLQGGRFRQAGSVNECRTDVFGFGFAKRSYELAGLRCIAASRRDERIAKQGVAYPKGAVRSVVDMLINQCFLKQFAFKTGMGDTASHM